MNPKGQLRCVVGSFRDGDVFAPFCRVCNDMRDIVVAKLLAVETLSVGIDKSKVNTCLFAACDGTRPKANDDGRSGGDVDSFSFLLWLLRKTRLKRCLCSTWCISKVDIEEFHRQIRLGRIGQMDFYVGEILPKSYPEEYAQMGEIARDSGGRLAVFRNHSKVMAGIGDKFSFAIESSANVNTNPRTEQTVVTIDRGIADFYFAFYDGIISFDKDWRNGENQTDRLNG